MSGRLRVLSRPTAWFITSICATITTFVILLHSTILARLNVSVDTIVYRAAFLLVIIIVAFLIHPAVKTANRVRWYDVLLILLALPPLVYLIAFQNVWLPNMIHGKISTHEVVLGVMLMVVLFEAMRRVAGLGMVIIVLAFVIHPFIANYLPGFLHAPGYSLSRAFGVWYTGLD